MNPNGNNTETAPEKRLQEQVEKKKSSTRQQFGTFDQYAEQIPVVSLNIFGLSSQPHFAHLRHLVETTRSACLFTLDSGEENALA